jgi:hypothetical protein
MATLMTVLIGLGVLGVLALGGLSARGLWGQEHNGAILARWTKRRESLENVLADLRHDRDTRTLSPREFEALSRDVETRLEDARRVTAKLLRARYSRVAQQGREVPEAVRRDIEDRVRALRRSKDPGAAAGAGA